MAESPDVDFRTEYDSVIQEVQCPSTPGPQLSIKSPDLSTSGSSEETDVVRGNANGNQSPPPNCAICLGRCKNKCYTESCMHQFCFKCLLEWSKVKPECPLCKQTFKSIVHNIKAIGQYDKYLVQQPSPVSPIPHAYPQYTLPAHLSPRLPAMYNRQAYMYMEEFEMNTLDLTGTSSNTNHGAHRPAPRRNIPGPAQLIDIYQENNMQGEGRSSLSQLWRRYVYDRRLYALPMPDISGHFRESSARFYRDNPSQVHRIIPWADRDIVCLLRNTEHDVSTVMNLINGMLMTCNILSPEFRRRLQPFLGSKTVHFIHELNNFARSPFDMNGYDQTVQYASSNTEEVIEFSSTSSANSDVESVNNDQQPSEVNRGNNDQSSALIRRLRANIPMNSGIANSGSNFQLFTPSTEMSAQSSAINLSTHNRGTGGDTSEGTTTTSTVEVVHAPTPERPTNIVLSSSSSDDCEFVLEQKPPHLRTPEMVSLNSNSDSDVVFVQETKTTPMPSGMAKWASTFSSRVRRARRQLNSSINNTSFNSSNSDSDSFQCEDKPKKMKLDGREDNAASEGVTDKPSTSKTENDQLPKVKEEFNLGASTSTGLTSRYRNSRPPNVRIRSLRRYSDTTDSNEIEDSRASSSESCFTTGDSSSESDSDTSWSKSRRYNNKQSLKRSRQRKLSAASSSRKSSRRQHTASAKSKRSKRTKNNKPVSNKSSAAKKKKTIKRSRRKSSKSKTSHRKRRTILPADSSTSEDEQQEKSKDDTQQAMAWTCTPYTQNNNDPSQSQPQQNKYATSTPVLNSSSSDTNDAAGGASSTTTTVAGTGFLTSTSSKPPMELNEDPNAKLAIYSDSD